MAKIVKGIAKRSKRHVGCHRDHPAFKSIDSPAPVKDTMTMSSDMCSTILSSISEFNGLIVGSPINEAATPTRIYKMGMLKYNFERSAGSKVRTKKAIPIRV